jgi:hypothetical protein
MTALQGQTVMTKEYSYQDIPNTLNSISWQLKRIAEALESIDERQQRETAPANPKVESTLLRKLLEKKDLEI